MARSKIHSYTDMSDATAKRQLIAQIAPLVGEYEVTIEPRRNLRSLQQNKWYWACICSAFGAFLREQDYNINDNEGAHELMKARFLAVTVRNKEGKVIGRRVRSTTELTTEEFSDYCERCRAWLADMFGIIVEDPGFGARESMRPTSNGEAYDPQTGEIIG